MSGSCSSANTTDIRADVGDTSDEDLSDIDEPAVEPSDSTSSDESSDDSQDGCVAPGATVTTCLPTGTGNFVWLPVTANDTATQIPFTATPGPVHAPPRDAPPIEYLKLFLTDAFLDKVVEETNRYSAQFISRNAQYLASHPRSSVHQWIKTGNMTRAEFSAFIGLIFCMGLVRKPTVNSYWDRANQCIDTPFFYEHFNRDRFWLLLKFMHFADNEAMPEVGTPEYNKLYKIQYVIDHLVAKFRRHYCPRKAISIDESMVAYKGRTPHLRQYMPNKHHARFGIKVWCVCDATSGYTCTFEVYKGGADPQDAHGEGVTHNLVVRLLQQADVLYRGYHVGMDNYFTSPKLLVELYAKNTHATGTVRKNRKGLSVDCIRAKLKNQEVCERRSGELLCVTYKDKSKTPILLSTAAKAGYVDVTTRRNVEKRLPEVVATYNKIMGGVDLKDTKLYSYMSERRTMKWTTKAVFSMIGTAALNSYILYEENTSATPKHTRFQFMMSVVTALVDNYKPKCISRKRRTNEQIQQAQAQADDIVLPPTHEVQVGQNIHVIKKGTKRTCVGGHNKRKRSVFECSTCNVVVCQYCIGKYHS